MGDFIPLGRAHLLWFYHDWRRNRAMQNRRARRRDWLAMRRGE